MVGQIQAIKMQGGGHLPNPRGSASGSPTQENISAGNGGRTKRTDTHPNAVAKLEERRLRSAEVRVLHNRLRLQDSPFFLEDWLGPSIAPANGIRPHELLIRQPKLPLTEGVMTKGEVQVVAQTVPAEKGKKIGNEEAAQPESSFEHGNSSILAGRMCC